MKKIYDFVVIGGGVVGSSIARELTKYRIPQKEKIDVAVLEKEPDVVNETSARNSGVIHAGFANKTGTKMARFCVEGNEGFEQIAKELDVPFRRIGKLVIGFDEKDLEAIKEMKTRGDANGCKGLEVIDRKRIKELAPALEGNYALHSPMTGVTNPYLYTIATAENACHNGAEYHLCCEVKSITKRNEWYEIETSKGAFLSRWVINSAGLNSDKVSDMLGIHGYTIYPCRGEYFILDKNAGKELNMLAYPVPDPTKGGNGTHLTVSIDGNILIGPSNEYLDSRKDYSVTKEVLDMMFKEAKEMLPSIQRTDSIRNFSGIRPKLTSKEKGGYGDFVIEYREEAPNAVNLVGIESPGLTAAAPIAREVLHIIQEHVKLEKNENFDPYRKGIVSFYDKTLEEKEKLIQEDPDYGEIICRCETITKAEVLEAIHNPLGVDTVTGIKYRCRAMMGRCQGGYCQTRITEMIQQEKNKQREDVLYNREGSYMFTGKVR